MKILEHIKILSFYCVMYYTTNIDKAHFGITNDY